MITNLAAPVTTRENRWTLSSSAASSAIARRQIAEQLHRWNLEHLADDIVLTVSELVTNGVSHGSGPVWHSLRLIEADGVMSVRLVVGDHGSGWGTAVPSGTRWYEECGRGLCMVEAVATAWGRVAFSGGHVVWADFAVQPLADTPDEVSRETSLAGLVHSQD